jgi:hypothetical protein
MNENVLAGMRCPECGSYGPFDIGVVVTGTARVTDDGFDYSEIRGGEASWGPGDSCECVSCGHEATAGEFGEEE